MRQTSQYLFLSYFCFLGMIAPLISQSPTLLIQASCSSDTTSCHETNLLDCRGPRSIATCSTYLTFDPSEVIDVTAFGAVGDGLFDNTAKLRELALMDKVLYFPPNNVFLVHGTINLLKGIYGGGTIRFTNVTCFTVGADSVFVRDVTIESTLNTGTNAPFAVSVTNHHHFELSNCRLINTRVEQESNMEDHVIGCTILSNTFVADFSPFQPNVFQNDIISLRGIDSAWVCHNEIQLTNVHRAIKIAESLASPFSNQDADAQISPWNARNIWIRDNIITGSTTSNKQVIDLFDGTELFTLEHNYIDVRGFTSIVENKTGFTTDFTQNTVIRNNVLKNDNIIFSFQGSHGANNSGHDSGHQNILVSNNCLEGLHPFRNNTSGLVEIRFFHEVSFMDNELSFQQMETRFAASFLSNLRLQMKRNMIANGGLRLSLALTNHEAETYRDSIRQIEVDSNQFINGYHNTLNNCIWVQSIGDDEGYLSIYGNHFYFDGTTPTSALVQLNSLNFDSVNVSCNVVEPNYMGLDGINYAPPAMSKFIENSNTWNNDDCKAPTSNIYYVTANALTTGTGARTCPWVLDTAVAKAVAGDIVYVLAGDYGAKSLTFSNSGTAAAPIHFIGCTTFPSLEIVGQTEIEVSPPLSSFEDFLNNEIENTNASVMPLLNGEYMVNRAMNISYRSHLQIKNFSITNYVEAGIQGENFLNKVTLKNITVTNIGSNIPNGETVECNIGNGELDDETNEPFCGYGIELYGDSCLIEECIVVNAGAHNISCWRGTGHHILNCKSYGNLKATNGPDYYILINQGDHNKIEGCYVERQDGLAHKGHGIGFTHASFNEVLDCMVKNSREGFYARGDAHYNVFKDCKTVEAYNDGRQGDFPAVHIRDGASYNQFINCHFKNAAVAVRVLGSVILEDYNGKLVGIGTGHHSLFYNCLFDRPRTHIELQEYLTNDCLGLKNCTAGIGCDPTLNPCLTCADELSTYSCLNCMDLQDCVDSLVAAPGYIEGGHLFVNCIFMGEGTVNDNLIMTNQRDTIATDTNRIINSIIYDISSYRACTNGTSLNKLYTATPPTFFPDVADCENTAGCCPDFINKESVSPDYFKIENSLIHKNGFYLPHFVPNFAADNNVSGDPEFIDVLSNYQLSCNSPAINAGMDPSSILTTTFGDSLAPDIPLFDFDGVTRPLENIHDMGIYEQTLGSPNSLVTSETSLNSFYRNQGTITSNGMIPMGQTTKIYSETSITLTPGFHANVGSDFLAKIEVCNSMNLQEAINRNNIPTNVSIPTPTKAANLTIYPNPFTTFTTISLDLPEATTIRLDLLDNTGSVIQSIQASTQIENGKHDFFLMANDLSTGVYLVRVLTKSNVYLERVVIVR